jgi:hypothetical protein
VIVRGIVSMKLCITEFDLKSNIWQAVVYMKIIAIFFFSFCIILGPDILHIVSCLSTPSIWSCHSTK